MLQQEHVISSLTNDFLKEGDTFSPFTKRYIQLWFIFVTYDYNLLLIPDSETLQCSSFRQLQ